MRKYWPLSFFGLHFVCVRKLYFFIFKLSRRKNWRRFTRIQRIENPFDQRKSASENIVNMLALVAF